MAGLVAPTELLKFRLCDLLWSSGFDNEAFLVWVFCLVVKVVLSL